MEKEEMHHGLNTDPNPRKNDVLEGGPPVQTQGWPGLDAQLDPAADHGEKSYRGGGKLKGRKALVTGGDSGIGRAVAIAFAREGADVAISYYNEHEDARETVRWIEEAGRKAFAMEGDIQTPEHCRSLVERTVKQFGGLNILVNNAAYHRETNDFTEITPEQLEQTFRTNVFATIWMAQNAVPHLKAGDSIINVGSVVGLLGNPGLSDYAATKAAIHDFNKSLSLTLADKGIRVNCVAPGPVWTPLIASTRFRDKVGEFGADSLWGRAAQPAELAPSFVFLASEDAKFYTGEIFSPTGMAITTR